MTYLLDTNVISELRKRNPDPHVLAWYGKVASGDIFVSVLTIGEIRLGIERLRQKLLERWLHGMRHTYKDRIINVDAAIAEEWGRLNTRDPLPIIDGLLAASAKVRGWSLVTRNTAGVARTGVTLVNPFDPAAS
jgi:predicted nucleic acid-binding protein